jgi:hypothetical protein
MYVNRIMRSVKIVPGMWKGQGKENGGGSEFKYEIFDVL